MDYLAIPKLTSSLPRLKCSLQLRSCGPGVEDKLCDIGTWVPITVLPMRIFDLVLIGRWKPAFIYLCMEIHNQKWTDTTFQSRRIPQKRTTLHHVSYVTNLFLFSCSIGCRCAKACVPSHLFKSLSFPNITNFHTLSPSPEQRRFSQSVFGRIPDLSTRVSAVCRKDHFM